MSRKEPARPPPVDWDGKPMLPQWERDRLGRAIMPEGGAMPAATPLNSAPLGPDDQINPRMYQNMHGGRRQAMSDKEALLAALLAGSEDG